MGPKGSIIEYWQVGFGLGKEETCNARIILHQLSVTKKKKRVNFE